MFFEVEVWIYFVVEFMSLKYEVNMGGFILGRVFEVKEE